jgi:hypothetical integral membrane protein (TIGR02206 family)
MSDYFEYGDVLTPFVFFSLSHWLPLIVTVILASLLLMFRQTIRRLRQVNHYRYLLASILIIFDIALYVWYGTSGTWDVSHSLPLHLCSLTLILSILMLLTKSYRLYEFIYFAGIGGALQALLTPAAILSGFPHFTYYYFFVAHGGIILACLYMTWMYGFRPTLASLGRTMIYLNLLLIPVAFINRWTDGNYLFISGKPAEPSLLDLLGPWPWYIVAMEVVALVVFTLLYVPFLITRKKPQREGA